ncbi:MAG: DUF5615 family PIN-like protein [Candidatus Nanohaloarchaea archaeon]
MKFLLDENIDSPVAEMLDSRGIDVLTVDQVMKGATDQEVLEKAVEEERVLVTFDRDFTRVERNHCGIIRFTSTASYRKLAEIVEHISETFAEEDMDNTVVEASPSDY